MSAFLTDHGVIIAVVCALIAVAYGVLTTTQLLALSPGNAEMQRISAAVQEGARAYLNRQYLVIAGVGIVLFIALLFIQDIYVAVGFAIGGILSGSAGYIGMNVSVRSNARVAESARDGIGPALKVAFRGGAITGMLVVGLALLGVAGYYGLLTSYFDQTPKEAVDALIGLGFGGSLISVFARLGGGIFTKAADVGGLSEDAAAKTSENGDQRSTKAKSDQCVNGFLRGLIEVRSKQAVVAGDAQQGETNYQHAGDRAATEGDLQGRADAVAGRLGNTGVGADRNVHADVASRTGEDAADREANGDVDVLDEEQRDEKHDADACDYEVLAV